MARLPSAPASKLSRGDARPGYRCTAGDAGGPEWREAARFREPLFIAPEARNSADRIRQDDAGAAETDSPGPERRSPDGGQWRSRPRALLVPSSTEKSQVSTGYYCGWIYGKREDLQHERLRLDRRWNFPQRAQNLGTNFIQEDRLGRRGDEPDRHTYISPAKG